MTQPLLQPPPADQPPGISPGEVLGAAGVILAYQQASQAIRQQLSDLVTAAWWALGVWRDPQREQFTADVVPLVEAAMAQMGSLTAGYLAAVGQEQASQLVVPTVVPDLTIRTVRNGADPAEVYGRPFHLAWRRLAELPHEPGAIDHAIEAGAKRAVQLAVTDLQLAKTHTSQQVLAAAPRVIGYRRVLEGPHSCGLCILASTVVYHHKKLLPIHPGCDCSVAEITAGSDPAQQVNDHLVGDVHAAIATHFGSSSAAGRAIGGQDGLQYRDVLIEHTHGELGPVLAIRGQGFTGPNDI